MGTLSALPALAATPPPNVGDQLQRLMALKTALGQQQLQQSALQTQGLQQTGFEQENEQRALALKDSMTLRSLSTDPKYIQKDANGKVSGFDTNGLLTDAASKGVNPQTLNKMKLDYADIVQKTAAAGKAQIDLEDQKNDKAYQILEGVRSLKDPTARLAAYQQAAPKIQELGVDPTGLPQTPDDAALQAFEAHLGVHKQVLADAKTVAETQANQAKVTSAETQANEFKARMPGGALYPPAIAEAEATNPRIQGAKLALSTAEGQARAAIQANPPSVPLNDTQKATVQAVLEGRQSPPGSFALKTPYWQNIMGEVYKQDPQWSEQRAQLRKDFTVGKHSSEINAVNTAMTHIGVLGDAIDNLNNTNMVQWNRFANAVGVEVGKDPKTTFDAIVHRVAPELAAAYGENTVDARNKAEADFKSSLGPTQLKSNVSTTVGLIRGKIGSLENQWNQNKSDSMPSFEDRFISPAAKQQLDKWNPQGGGAAQHAPGAKAGLPEGQTGTGSDGKKYVVKGGVWVAQ